MTVRFTTNQFEASHGRKPKGRGTWAFELVPGEVWFAPMDLTLTEAKAAAKAAAPTGTTTIAVLP